MTLHQRLAAISQLAQARKLRDQADRAHFDEPLVYSRSLVLAHTQALVRLGEAQVRGDVGGMRAALAEATELHTLVHQALAAEQQLAEQQQAKAEHMARVAAAVFN